MTVPGGQAQNAVLSAVALGVELASLTSPAANDDAKVASWERIEASHENLRVQRDQAAEDREAARLERDEVRADLAFVSQQLRESVKWRDKLIEAKPHIYHDVPGEPIGHDGWDCDENCAACHFCAKARAAVAEAESLRQAIRHVIDDSPGTPHSVKQYLAAALAAADATQERQPHDRYRDALRKLAGEPEHPPQTEEAALVIIEVQHIAREVLGEPNG